MYSKPFSSIPGRQCEGDRAHHRRKIIALDHLPPDLMSAARIEHHSPAIFEVLDKTAWNKAKATRLPGIYRVTLYQKIKRCNLTVDIPRC
ncbi:MAG: helix-turn-helix domain-containing protein [Syntrophobacteraceae bacterium]